MREILKRAQEAEPCMFLRRAGTTARQVNPGTAVESWLPGLCPRSSELDGSRKYVKVIVLGATNRPDLWTLLFFDQAGFDKSIHIGTTSDPVQQLSYSEALAQTNYFLTTMI